LKNSAGSGKTANASLLPLLNIWKKKRIHLHARLRFLQKIKNLPFLRNKKRHRSAGQSKKQKFSVPTAAES
jgi:hypothetical protein